MEDNIIHFQIIFPEGVAIYILSSDLKQIRYTFDERKFMDEMLMHQLDHHTFTDILKELTNKREYDKIMFFTLKGMELFSNETLRNYYYHIKTEVERRGTFYERLRFKMLGELPSKN